MLKLGIGLVGGAFVAFFILIKLLKMRLRKRILRLE